MNREETIVLQLLTGKNHPDDVPLEQLQQLADTYPYFAATQLLLAKKMQQEKHPRLQEQLYKTALYFPDEQWLRYLLAETHDRQTIQPSAAQIEDKIESKDETDEDADTTTQELINNDPAQETHPEEITETEDNNIITLPAATLLEEISKSHVVEDEPEEAPLDDEELRQQTEPLPIEESNQKIASLLSEQAEVFHKPLGSKLEIHVAAEPFHTVDYFASQGIKLDKEQQENTFDKKVHKFTDWLRQMKRINSHPADLGTGEEEENQVANVADSSNYTKEIVTESMANVLLKQGKKEKAAEIYQKLSLLYPDKNTYFAALIQQIK